MMNRRNFLSGVGAGTLLAPFVPLTERMAEAAGYPTRLVIVQTPNGVSDYAKWFRCSGTENDWALGEILSPLAPFKQDMITFDNIADLNYQGRTGHAKAAGQLLTGKTVKSVVAGKSDDEPGSHLRADGISIDQHIAKAVGGATPYPILNWGVLASQAHSIDALGAMISYRAALQPVTPEINPYKMFERVFSTPATSDGAPDPAQGRRRSVLDVVRRDLDRMREKLGTFDRKRLDAHLESVREIERALDPSNRPDVPTAASCTVDGEPLSRLNVATNTISNLKVLADPVVKMLAKALACDLTRVATLQLSITTSNIEGSEIGWKGSIHQRSHTDGTEELMKFQKWMAAGPISALLNALKEVPEGNGTLLDNTAFVWAQELSDGNTHVNTPLPVVFFGRAGGRWRPGRHLRFSSPRAHTDLWVTLAQAMGLPDQSFGDNSTGPIAAVG